MGILGIIRINIFLKAFIQNTQTIHARHLNIHILNTFSQIFVTILESLKENKIGELEARLDGDDELAFVNAADKDSFEAYENGLIVYTTKTNRDDELVLSTIEAGLRSNELKSGEADMRHGYIKAIDGDIATVVIDGVKKAYDVTSKEVTDMYEDHMIIVVYVSEDDDFDTNNQYVIDSFEVIDADEVEFEEFDRLSQDSATKVSYIIRGMNER